MSGASGVRYPEESMRISPLRIALVVLSLVTLWPAIQVTFFKPLVASAQTRLPTGVPPIVFVSRGIPPTGTVYWSVPKDMPGVGPYSRFRVAAPGRLIVLEPNGTVRVLVDGANPTAASLNLIDVNAPDVSYDGRRIVFAGFSSERFNASEDTRPLFNPDGWRLYVINADGSGLRQLTNSDQNLDYSQFGTVAAPMLRGYDDTDPAWLPNGKIVFSSTRWPSFSQYGGARTSNLYVMNADGSGLHRITAERNGADRPLVDPATGKIVYSRWWRNFRFATNDMATVAASNGGYRRKDGLTIERGADHLGGFDFQFRNNWHAAVINPDGTELGQWAGPHNRLDAVHVYGGSFAPDGDLIANYFPMTNMTEASGFGGLRRYERGATSYKPILGITQVGVGQLVSSSPPSFGVYKGVYATEPAALLDGRIVISLASSINQDYGLYLIDENGQSRTLLYDRPGTTELRAKLLQARPTPPIIADSVRPVTSGLPPREGGPYDAEGTFVFDALNVYANGPVDTIDVSAPRVGSAKEMRFFADFQRISHGSFESLDWPILLSEKPINGDGSVREPNAPAGIPLFEQVRSADGTVPFTTGTPGGVTHVAGMNFGMPGAVVRCVGCHSGHTQIPVPASDEEAKWSNLAPGADVRVSSARNTPKGLTDRRVTKSNISDYWYSASGATGQWVELAFPEPVTVRTVRLYNPPFASGSTLQVQSATVRLGLGGQWVASSNAGALSPSGVDVSFAQVKAQTVRVEIGAVSGKAFDGSTTAALAEVEVIARAGAAGPSGNAAPAVKILSPATGAAVPEGAVALTASAVDAQDGDISAKIIWRSSLAGEIGRGAAVSPKLLPGAHTITATATDSGNVGGTASIILTVNKAATANKAPTVRIVSPASGATVTQGAVALKASATDPEDGDLSAKTLWRSNLVGVIGRGAAITPDLLPGAHIITAAVTDSGGITRGAAITLTVNKAGTGTNQPPAIQILSPANRSTVAAGAVSLRASALDPEDGDISARIIWRSSLLGEIGRGAAIAPNLPAGTHSIVATVSDSKGVSRAALIALVVTKTAPNQLPAVVILQPTNAATLKAGVATSFTGRASDPEDGDLSSQVIWSSNLIGYLGRGATVLAKLNAGTHRITARAVDKNGGSASTTIFVTAGP